MVSEENKAKVRILGSTRQKDSQQEPEKRGHSSLTSTRRNWGLRSPGGGELLEENG